MARAARPHARGVVDGAVVGFVVFGASRDADAHAGQRRDLRALRRPRRAGPGVGATLVVARRGRARPPQAASASRCGPSSTTRRRAGSTSGSASRGTAPRRVTRTGRSCATSPPALSAGRARAQTRPTRSAARARTPAASTSRCVTARIVVASSAPIHTSRASSASLTANASSTPNTTMFVSTARVQPHAGDRRKAVGERARQRVVVGQPLDVVVQRVEGAGRHDARLAHRAAHHLLPAPRLLDELGRAGQAGAQRRAEALREVDPGGVEQRRPAARRTRRRRRPR